MPKKIPTIESRVGGVASQRTLQPFVPVTDGGVGRGLQTLGAGLRQGADALRQKFERDEVEDLTNQVFDFQSKMDVDFKNSREEAIADAGGLRKLQGKEWDEELQSRFTDGLRQIGNEVQTDAGRRFYNQQVLKLSDRFNQSVSIARQQVAGVRAIQKHEQLVQSLSISAFNNPNQFRNFIGDYEESLAATGLTGDKAAQVRGGSITKIANSAFQGLMDQDLDEAKRQLDAGAWDDVLKDGEHKARLKANVERKIEVREHKQARIASYKQSDPYKFLSEIGEQPPALNFQEAAESFVERQNWNIAKSQEHGLRNLPFISKDEANQFIQQMNSQPPARAAEIMNNLDQDVQPEILVQLGQAAFSQSPSKTVALMNAGEDKEVSRHIISGARTRADKAVKLPPPSQFETDFDKNVLPSLFKEQPALRVAFREAAINHYVSRLAEEEGQIGDTVKGAEFRASIEAVMGPIAEVNNSQITSFRSAHPDRRGEWQDSSAINRIVRRLDDSIVQRVQGDVPRTVEGESINVAKSRSRMQLFPVGEGRYRIAVNGKMALTKKAAEGKLSLQEIADGKGFFTLDLKAIEAAAPALRDIDMSRLTPEDLRRIR